MLKVGAANKALVETQRASVQAPELEDTLKLLFEIMRDHGTSGACFRAANRCLVIDPRQAEILRWISTFTPHSRHRHALRRLAFEVRRYHAMDRELLIWSSTVLRATGSLGPALTALKRVAILEPCGHTDIHNKLWRLFIHLGRHDEAARVTARWMVSEADETACLAYCDTAGIISNAEGFATALERTMTYGHAPFSWKMNVVRLSRKLAQHIETNDTSSAIALARRLASHPGFVRAFAKSVRAEPATRGLIRQLQDCAQDDILRTALAALLEDTPGIAIEYYERFAETGAPLPEEWSATVADGRHQGHPLWHVANPFFTVWSTASDQEHTQREWRNPDVFDTSRDEKGIRNEFQDWMAEKVPARSLLHDLIAGLGPRTTRVLDIGCGFGVWLRYLAEYCGVPVENLGGIDFHAARVAASQHQLIEAVRLGAHCAGAPKDVVKRTIRNLDCLELVP
ncbi:MAG: hypothetical protein CMM47_01350 [Rhodospirillaceae bacterium]|nr:hypothetical protein [Rhodospirillaceae bacterium]